ncbi:MAG: 2Fe-2S iron-sulfur cluster-binding protein [Deltaproteobacteria bacterium]|nr:2Fe-2S iron-sulfur cluster-binding protein [Deltaproteobacteria bacterium]
MNIEITIDNKKIMTKSGLTILEAASQAGIKIPTLCYLKRLRPIGSCRICVVEVKGIQNPLPSCVARVKEGYEILTDTEKVWKVRKESLSHLLLDHPLDCPVCDKSGECDLQNLSFEFGLTTQKNNKGFPDRTHIFKSDLIEYTATRCILCSRCIRVCTDMYGNPFYQIKNKGYNGYIGLKIDDKLQLGSNPSENCSFTEIKPDINYLNCYYCGNCVDVCPVGALLSKSSKFKERYWQESPFSSVCDKCSAACRIEYYRYDKEESLVRTASLFGGYLCKYGFFYEGIGMDNGYYISSPYIKKKSRLEETTFENSIKELALKIKNISEKGDMNNTAVLVSPNVSINDGFAIAGFVKNILKPAYFDIAEPEFYRTNFNKFKAVFKSEELFDIKAVRNSEIMLYVGSIEDDIPYALYNIMKTHREHGGKLLLVNIKKDSDSSLTRFEDIAYTRRDINISSIHDFLTGLRSGLYDYAFKKDDEIVKNMLKANSISVILGDGLLSAYDISTDILILKEIVEFLRDEQKTLYIYPLIKPFNYRGLLTAGINPSENGFLGFDSINSGLSGRKIKNLIYIGDASNDSVFKDIAKHAADMDFLAVLSSKTSMLSAMADIVIPVKDFLESRNLLYENFEGNIININNEFHLGGVRHDILTLLIEISNRLGYSFNYIKEELQRFIDSFKTKDMIYYNKIKARSNFYYNDKTKKFY